MQMAYPGFQFLQPHNVWAIGRTMHDLLTLHYPYFLRSRMEHISERRYYNNLKEHAIPVIVTKRTPEYSEPLRKLIRECLHVEIGKRPAAEEVLERALDGVEKVREARRKKGGGGAESVGPKLFYMGHEINHMPIGDANISMARSEWDELNEDHWPDPDLEKLHSARWEPKKRADKSGKEPVGEGERLQKRRRLDAHVRGDSRRLESNSRGVIWNLHPSATALKENVGNDDDDDKDKPKDQESPGERPKKPSSHDKNGKGHDNNNGEVGHRQSGALNKKAEGSDPKHTQNHGRNEDKNCPELRIHGQVSSPRDGGYTAPVIVRDQNTLQPGTKRQRDSFGDVLNHHLAEIAKREPPAGQPPLPPQRLKLRPPKPPAPPDARIRPNAPQPPPSRPVDDAGDCPGKARSQTNADAPKNTDDPKKVDAPENANPTKEAKSRAPRRRGPQNRSG
jgi:hypothetical protein